MPQSLRESPWRRENWWRKLVCQKVTIEEGSFRVIAGLFTCVLHPGLLHKFDESPKKRNSTGERVPTFESTARKQDDRRIPLPVKPDPHLVVLEVCLLLICRHIGCLADDRPSANTRSSPLLR